MATVIQLLFEDRDRLIAEHHCADLFNRAWHATYSIDDPRTLCGVQLMGEDGIVPGDPKEGRVTCQVCRSVLEQVQAIKKWR